MFREMFDLMSNVFYFPLIWFEKILNAPDMDGARGILLAAFSVFMSFGLLLRPLRGSGFSDRARKKPGVKEPNKDNKADSKPASDD